MKRAHYDSEGTTSGSDEEGRNVGVGGACFGGNWITSWMSGNTEATGPTDNANSFITRQSTSSSFFLQDKAVSKRVAKLPYPTSPTSAAAAATDDEKLMFRMTAQMQSSGGGGVAQQQPSSSLSPPQPQQAAKKRDSGTTTTTAASTTPGGSLSSVFGDDCEDVEDDENDHHVTDGSAVAGAVGGSGGHDADEITSSSSAAAAAGASSSNIENVHDATQLIAQEMNRMSLVEREEAYEDLHGVAVSIRETPDLLTTKLQEMEYHLQQHLLLNEEQHQQQGQEHHQQQGQGGATNVQSNTPPPPPSSSSSQSLLQSAYSIANGQNVAYCHDPKLRLMFLRADKYNSQKAAQRMIDFFDWKLQLFGISKLCVDIQLSDMDKDDNQTIQYGLLQILPSRDSRGRIVFCNAPTYFKDTYRTADSGLKTLYYMVMSAMEDSNSQKSGSVLIFYGLGPEKGYNPRKKELFIKATKLIGVLPFRLDAVHFCVPSPLQSSSFVIISPFVALIQNSIGKYFRARFRVHCGSHTECQYALMTFGIPSTLLPITSEGQELKRTNHIKWFKRRKIKEKYISMIKKKTLTTQKKPAEDLLFDESLYFNGVDLPSQLDVLLGRGKPLTEHAGNRRLDELVRTYYDEYNATTGKGNHAALSYRLVQIIQKEGGGRFLKRNEEKTSANGTGGGWWVPVSDEEATDKVGHAFRTKRGSQTKQQILSSTTYSASGSAPASSSSASAQRQGGKMFQNLPYHPPTNRQLSQQRRSSTDDDDDGISSSCAKMFKFGF